MKKLLTHFLTSRYLFFQELVLFCRPWPTSTSILINQRTPARIRVIKLTDSYRFPLRIYFVSSLFHFAYSPLLVRARALPMYHNSLNCQILIINHHLCERVEIEDKAVRYRCKVFHVSKLFASYTYRKATTYARSACSSRTWRADAKHGESLYPKERDWLSGLYLSILAILSL